MSAYKVDRGIPIPRVGEGRPRSTSVYPFAKLKAGDSFLVAATEKEIKKVSQRVRNATHNYKKRHGGKYAVRTLHGKGVRVWRIK